MWVGHCATGGFSPETRVKISAGNPPILTLHPPLHLNHVIGDVISVWRRDDVGDIDLIWGDKEKNAGIDHIVYKHVGEGLDFASEQEMIDTIDDIVRNGSVNKKRSKWDKIVLEKDGKIVVIRKNVRDENGNVVANKNWVVTSFDNNIPKSKKITPAATRATPDSNEGGRAVTPSVSSAGKGSDLFGNAQE